MKSETVTEHMSVTLMLVIEGAVEVVDVVLFHSKL